MKISKKPYLVNLIKENILYIILNITLVFLILFSLSFGIAQITENQNKLTHLQKDIQSLKIRINALQQIANNQNVIDSDIKLLTRLIPDTEDYFSIIYALEKLSQSTNFLITSYTVNPISFQPNKLKLTISGSGDSTSFINFLKEYNFGGGRLITSDNIEITPQQEGNFKIDLTFYNKKIEPNQTITSINPQLLKEIKNMLDKVNLNFDKEATIEASLDISYPRKSNPF